MFFCGLKAPCLILLFIVSWKQRLCTFPLRPDTFLKILTSKISMMCSPSFETSTHTIQWKKRVQFLSNTWIKSIGYWQSVKEIENSWRKSIKCSDSYVKDSRFRIWGFTVSVKTHFLLHLPHFTRTVVNWVSKYIQKFSSTLKSKIWRAKAQIFGLS